FAFAWSVTKNGAPFAAGSGANFSFTPDDNGTYVVTLMATDKDAGVGTASATLTVSNTPPSQITVTAGPATINEGDTTTLTGTFTDPGALDTHTVAINWGDGSAVTALNLAAGVFAFSAAHTYLDNRPGNAPFPVTVTVTDSSNGSGTGSTAVTVS